MADRQDWIDLAEFEAELPVRELLMALGDPIARHTVAYLREETTDSLDHLAEVVTGWANASTGTIATRADRDRTRRLLYHVYLPTLDRLDVLQFDAERRTVSVDDTSDVMDSFLERIQHLERTAGSGK